MALRDSLTADQLSVFSEVLQDCAQLYVDGCWARDLMAASEGTRAVAEAAWYPGHPLGTVEAIQQEYEHQQAEARKTEHAA